MRDEIQKFTKNATDNYTETNDRVLDAVVDTNRKAVDFAVKTADQVTERIEQIDDLPEFKLADKVPTPAETGARYLEFVERAVEMNREFTQRIVERLLEIDAVAPAVEKPVAKKAPAKKAAKKPAAKKPEAKKPAAKKAPVSKTAAAS
jgi:sec-independent protein translocase protein TatB